MSEIYSPYKPENYEKLWEITLSNKDYSKIIKYANVTDFEYHSTGLKISCIELNEACKPKKVWSATSYSYNKDKQHFNPILIGCEILRFEDIYNIDIQKQSEAKETYHAEIIVINKDNCKANLREH